MKTKIKEVHDYFRDKIVNGEFDVVKIEEHHITVSVDRIYNFIIWTANGESPLSTYPGSWNGLRTFMHLGFRVKDKEKLWPKMNKIMKDYDEKFAKKDREASYKRLKKEFG